MTHMDANVSRNRALSECGAEAELIHVSKRLLKFAKVRLENLWVAEKLN